MYISRLMIAFVIIVLVGAQQYWVHREEKHPPGVLAPSVPLQTDEVLARPVKLKGVVLDELAEYNIRARVLSTRRYWLDRMAKIAPVDVAVGWGAMSDSKIIEQMTFRQADRFYFYSWRNPEPLDPHVMLESSANMHLIPADDVVEKEIKNLRIGNLVSMKGHLVRVNFPDGSEAKSSLTRTDSGAGACEIMLVQAISVE